MQYNVKKMEQQNRNLQKKVLQAEKLQKEVAMHNLEMEDARKELEQRMISAGHGVRRKLSASIPSGMTEEDMFRMKAIQEGDEEEEDLKMAPLNSDGETRTLFSRNTAGVKLKSESAMTLQSEQTSGTSSATGSTPASSDSESGSGSGSDGTESSDEDSDLDSAPTGKRPARGVPARNKKAP